MNEPPRNSVYVDHVRLRQRFNELGYYAMVQRREFTSVVDREWLAPPAAGQVAGTKGQRVFYLREGELVAVVHQYLFA
jgi:hypothetical protein